MALKDLIVTDAEKQAIAAWKDWFASRVYFLTNFAKEPTKEARRIANEEMKLLRADRRH